MAHTSSYPPVLTWPPFAVQLSGAPRACATFAPSSPVRTTHAATTGAGAPRRSAIGSASATVTERGTSARARPAGARVRSALPRHPSKQSLS